NGRLNTVTSLCGKFDRSFVPVAAALAWLGLCGIGHAQFHSGPATGQVVPSANGTMVTNSPNAPAVYRGQNQGAGMFDTGAVDGAKLGYIDFRTAEVWGRAIYHADGSYTESNQPIAENSMTQETKSANGVTLMKRLITFDTSKRPSEILIYDGRGNFRYRGQILYDRLGRFNEEQIYDTKNQLLRRTIQEYNPAGQALPLKVVDDLSKIPADLKLIITQADGVPTREQQLANQQRFWDEAREVKPAQAASGNSGAAAAGTAASPKKESVWSRFNPFAKKK
ncbi:MAG: hypothetical protein KDM64_00290, partial [Verrucomicrobiae bacterium]|nr:hypothetical protein [Verrucomicrobiae bacterium]